MKCLNHPSTAERCLLIYGFFAVLCHSAFLLLFASVICEEPSVLFPPSTLLLYLEYPLMSVTVLLGGGLALRYFTLRQPPHR